MEWVRDHPKFGWIVWMNSPSLFNRPLTPLSPILTGGLVERPYQAEWVSTQFYRSRANRGGCSPGPSLGNPQGYPSLVCRAAQDTVDAEPRVLPDFKEHNGEGNGASPSVILVGNRRNPMTETPAAGPLCESSPHTFSRPSILKRTLVDPHRKSLPLARC